MEAIPYIVVGALISGSTGFLVYWYARKQTPKYVYVATFIGWLFGFMMIGLLPYDIYVVIS